ncbi:MAG: protein kinase [Pseudomonadota bacterium]
MTDKYQLEEAFAAASELTGVERDAFLARFAQEHPDLVDHLRKLLEADADTERTVGDAVVSSLERIELDELDPWVGRTLGAWTIIKRIGSGGMGAVFLAERSGEFAQQAALKIMSAQLVHSDAKARFESERQILAGLRHPNIATLIDGGTDDNDLPFLVLEYVEGEPIDTYCEERNLGVDARVALMRKVCAAVDYAHRNLVVHRDLKPSNILVDEEGNPKLLDFGIAKLIAADDAGPVDDQTAPQAQVLTPQYASPEQVRGEMVSVASDVYALGVLLYRLLTHRSPYGDTGSSRREIESRILDMEPQRPSQVVTQPSFPSTKEGATSSAPSQLSPKLLQRKLRGDLDNIVLMCLIKEPERRYASASALSDDLERYLNLEPVLARGQSFTYQARKFAQRNTASMVAGGIGLFAVVALTVFYTVQLAQERDEAQLAAAQAEEVSGFLRTLFGAASPQVAQGDEVTAGDLLEQGLERIEALSDQPALQAELLDVIAGSYAGLGRFEEGQKQARRALAIREENLPEDKLAMLSSIYAIMDNQEDIEREDMIELAQRAVAIVDAQPATDTEVAATAHGRLGRALFKFKRYEEAAAQLEKSLALKESANAELDELSLSIRTDLASSYDYLERFDEAGPMFREVSAKSDELLGANHPDSILGVAHLGLFLARTGKHLAAVDAFAEAVRRSEIVFPDHPYLTAFKRELGYTQYDAGLFAQARQTLEPLVAQVLEQDGEVHPQFINLSRNLGQVLVGGGAFEEGEAMLARSARAAAKMGSDFAFHIQRADMQIAKSQNLQGRFAQAEKRARDAIDAGPLGPDYQRYAALELAVSVSGQGRYAEADEAFEALIAKHEEEVGADSFLLTEVLAQYAAHLRRSGQLDEAVTAARRARTIGNETIGSENWRTVLATTQLAYALNEKGARQEATDLLRHADTILAPIMDESHPYRVEIAAVLDG